MRFRMLGPLEVRNGERAAALGGARQKSALALLLLHANRTVATSRLLDALWPAGQAPPSARKILQNAVSGLRGALAGDGRAAGGAVLVTRPPGYMLMVDPEQVDLHVFERLVAQGRARLARGEYAQAAAALREALDLWRGPALADLAETGVSWPELAAVENARLDATEDYFEAALACGRHHEVVRELEAAVRSEPLRERSCGHLMLALYRCGRQADALETYERTRTALVEDLGVDPGHELRALQRAILNHDPALRPAAAAGLPAPVEAAGAAGASRDGTASVEECLTAHSLPIVDREYELAVVQGMLERARHRRRPHLVTVLGGPGLGKTRFLIEVERRLVSRTQSARYLVSRCPATGVTIQSLGGAPRLPASELTRLEGMLAVDGAQDAARMAAVWKEFLAGHPLDLPLVLVIDDLHQGPDALLEFVDGLAAGSDPVPVLVVAAARADLLDRRPCWGGGGSDSAVLTLDRLSDTAVDQLLDFLWLTGAVEPHGPPGDRRDHLRGLLRAAVRPPEPLSR
ncbi:SARP family transcriptional regulator [Planomonospora sphaerica]|uniref:SARP family transcriptional regulator n=1 Tax=Planomonospora sphaerica TaxID=161355 RepID=A0A171AXF7_9ACTN|nr:BTAD domain-containing putative transcriptional regulator [Planomonospora sphaerica]GAT64411.1 SARP family transcriptional regulator [Planomonospora sphaerica]